MSDIDLTDFPLDPSSPQCRYLCTPEKPMPPDAPGMWTHTGMVEEAGEQPHVRLFKCVDCGVEWREIIWHLHPNWSTPLSKGPL